MPADQNEFNKLLALYGKQKKLFTHCFAEIGYLTEKRPAFSVFLTPDKKSVFDLGSFTKALVTTPLVFEEIKAERLKLDSTIGTWLRNPECLRAELLKIKIEDLLAHQSGLPAWRNFYVCQIEKPLQLKLKEKESKICEILNYACEALGIKGKDLYSDLGFILLGFCLEREKNKSLALIFEEFCQNRLNFSFSKNDIGFGSQIKNKTFISTGYCAVRKKELNDGEVWDENCAALGGVTGHCGLFASGEGLVNYLKALFLSPNAQLFVESNKNAIKGGNNSSLLGLRQGADPSANGFANGKAMGHMGFTGCAFWICPLTWRYAVILTNRVISGRLSRDIKEFRREGFRILDSFLPA